MHDSVAAEFFGISCSKMLEFGENVYLLMSLEHCLFYFI